LTRRVFEVANWLLAILMWLLIGRILLDQLTRGKSTVIGRLFHLATDPLLRFSSQLFPRFSTIAQSVLWVLALLAVRLILFVMAMPR